MPVPVYTDESLGFIPEAAALVYPSPMLRQSSTTLGFVIPLSGGRLALGTWQGIYLWEHRLRPHRREVALHLVGN
jgi:hypothetical protein